MLRLKFLRKPAHAGIAGLSVREFKPTGLQAGGCLVDFCIGYAITETCAKQ